MKAYMGHFGEVESTEVQTPEVVDQPLMLTAPEDAIPMSYNTSSNLFTTASNIAEKSLSTSLDKIASIAKAEEIQMFIEENGLAPYLQDVNKERVKNILALFGLWYVSKIVRSKVALAGLGALGIYVLYSNKDKLVDKISSKVA